MSDFDVDRMRAAERHGAVVTLARAFHDDPLFNFMVPNLRSQARALITFMGTLLADAQPFDEVWVARTGASATGSSDTATSIVASAVWLPPGAYPRTARREVMNYLRDLPAVPRLGRRLPASIRLETLLQSTHRRVAEPHWYLSLLGSDPGFQQRGAGSALLAPVLERCDEHAVPAYLETQKEANLSWYRRHGFELVQELRAAGCPSMWTMRREPR